MVESKQNTADKLEEKFQPKISREIFLTISELGQGAFGDVYLV
jgi:hypothetical protein